jgi:hypothetical protein
LLSQEKGKKVNSTTGISAFVLSAFLTSSSISSAHGQDTHHEGVSGHSHEASELHGGKVTMTDEFHFEVAFQRDQILVYGYDRAQKAIDLGGVSGTARVDFRDSGRDAIEVALTYVKPEAQSGHGHHGHAEVRFGHLIAEVDLGKVEEGNAKATLMLQGLPGSSEKEVRFKETFKIARLVEYSCPMNDTTPTSEPGSCAKCGMQLEPTRYIYACPDHPTVTSTEVGATCWLDGKNLQKTTDAATAEQAQGSHDTHSHQHGSHKH